MRFQSIAFLLASLLLSGCSPMNSEFSCNATASDSCMTIEQVDAMTRYADGNEAIAAVSHHQKKASTVVRDKSSTYSISKVWLAPRLLSTHKEHQ